MVKDLHNCGYAHTATTRRRKPPSNSSLTPLCLLTPPLPPSSSYVLVQNHRPKPTFLPLPAPTSPKRKDHMDHTHSLIPSFYLCRRTRQTPRAKFPPSSDALNQSRRIEIYSPLLPSFSSKETSFEGKRREGGWGGGGVWKKRSL